MPKYRRWAASCCCQFGWVVSTRNGPLLCCIQKQQLLLYVTTCVQRGIFQDSRTIWMLCTSCNISKAVVEGLRNRLETSWADLGRHQVRKRLQKWLDFPYTQIWNDHSCARELFLNSACSWKGLDLGNAMSIKSCTVTVVPRPTAQWRKGKAHVRTLEDYSNPRLKPISTIRQKNKGTAGPRERQMAWPWSMGIHAKSKIKEKSNHLLTHRNRSLPQGIGHSRHCTRHRQTCFNQALSLEMCA